MGMGLTVIISRITEHFEPQVHSPWPHNRKSGSKLGYALTRFQKPILGSTGSGELLHGPFAYYPSHRLGSDMSGPFSISQLCHSPPLQVTFGIRNILVNHRLVCSGIHVNLLAFFNCICKQLLSGPAFSPYV